MAKLKQMPDDDKFCAGLWAVVSNDGAEELTHLFHDEAGAQAACDKINAAVPPPNAPPPTDTVRKFLDVSTGHMTEGDNALLSSNLGNFSVLSATMHGEYGYLVWVGDTERDGFLERQCEMRETGFSEAFINLLTYAQQNGCEFVMLDADAGYIDGLPTFDW